VSASPNFTAGLAFTFGAVFFWGTQVPVAKGLLESMDSFAFGALRYLIALIGFAPILWWREGRAAFSTEGHGLRIAVAGGIGLAGERGSEHRRHAHRHALRGSGRHAAGPLLGHGTSETWEGLAAQVAGLADLGLLGVGEPLGHAPARGHLDELTLADDVRRRQEWEVLEP
jgi:hypothetical protein